MPKLKKGQTEQEFVSKCASNLFKNEPEVLTSKDKKSKQAYAICKSTYDREKKDKKNERIITKFEYFVEKINTDTKYDNITGGKANKLSLEDIARKHNVDVNQIEKQLEIGKLVQAEHTETDDEPKGNMDLNIEIALDHLSENPNYYTELIKSGIADEKEAIKKYKELYKD